MGRVLRAYTIGTPSAIAVMIAGAIVVGIGAVVEKTFEGGREALKDVGVPIESLAIIKAMKDGVIEFADE